MSDHDEGDECESCGRVHNSGALVFAVKGDADINEDDMKDLAMGMVNLLEELGERGRAILGVVQVMAVLHKTMDQEGHLCSNLMSAMKALGVEEHEYVAACSVHNMMAHAVGGSGDWDPREELDADER